MLHNSLKLYEIVSGALLPFIFFGLALKIAESKGFVYDLLRKVIRILSLEDHFPAETSGTRPHIYKHVRRTDDLLVVLYHYHGISQIAEPFKHAQKVLSITRMQSYGRFIQHIHRSHEGAPQRRHQIHSLALASGQRIAASIQGKIAQSHIYQTLDAVHYLLMSLANYLPLNISVSDTFEERESLIDRHRQHFVNVLSCHLDIKRLLFQSASVTDRTDCLAAETA